jgi:aspartate/methionine/tyrosine aminotransferase
MPSGTIAGEETLMKLVEFAKSKNILLVNDNPYSLILNNQVESILSYCNNQDPILELNSLSKSHNMAGWRVGMVSGKESLINHILTIKSNYDSGMFKPVQEAAVKALELNEQWYADINIEYAQRRVILWEFLKQVNCSFDKNASGMFVWAKIPKPYKNGEEFADFLLYKKGIFATPGIVFGSNGNQYIRFSLCAPISVFEESIRRLETLES